MSSNSSETWPEFPDDNKFDWSLSLSQIDKKYGTAPLKQPVFNARATQPKKMTMNNTGRMDLPSLDLLSLQPIEANRKNPLKGIVKFSNSSEFEKALAKKYPHAYGLIVAAEPDLPRWIFDNLVNSSKK